MIAPFRMLLVLVAFVAGPASAANLAAVELRGIDGELADNVRARLSIDRLTPTQRANLAPARVSHLLRVTPAEIREGLEPFGYYDVEVRTELVEQAGRSVVVAHVTLGEPVRVRSLELRVDGPAHDDPVVQAGQRQFHPVPGELLRHPLYEASKARIARSLGERGYFDAELERHRVEVTRSQHAADIGLRWISGPRYKLGAVRFEGQPLRAGVLDPLVPWKRGEPYDEAQLLALQQSLSDTDYFAGISLAPQPDRAVDGEVPVLVTLVPAKRSVYRFGLRYGTDAGAGVDARVERRWLNQRGHKVLVDVGLAQKASHLVAQYRIPGFGWLDGWYALALDLRQEEIDGLTSEYATLAATRSGRWRGWELLAGVNFRRERFDTVDARRQDFATLLYPSLWGRWKQGDDVNTPRRGRALTLELRGGAQALGSDVDFLQARAEGRYIRALSGDNRVLLRAELGSTWSNRFDAFPPSMRFYAGGDRSVRGYGYKEIGETERDRITGGRHLAVASVELEHMFTPVWGAAVFVDAGDAFDTRFEAQLGIGAGLRWRSPVGPVRVDLAHGLGEDGDGLRLHVNIGPDL